MKPKKISLKEIQGVLSRDEMKKIMAGSGGSNMCDKSCSSNSNCDSTCPYCEVNEAWDNIKMCFASA